MMSDSNSKKNNNNNKRTDGGLGKKSIFYDPDWNPEGIPPPGERQIAYNQATFKRKTELRPRLVGLIPENWRKQEE